MTPVTPAEIADAIAAAAHHVIAERGIGEVVSVSNHGHRDGLDNALKSDGQAMMRELYRALRPIAEKHTTFTEFHVWVGKGQLPVCIRRESILSALA